MGPPPLDGDYNRGDALNGIVWSLTIISVVLFSMRLYTRSIITRNLGYEDGIMGLALVSTATCTCGLGH
jgi:hypothetical protein